MTKTPFRTKCINAVGWFGGQRQAFWPAVGLPRANELFHLRTVLCRGATILAHENVAGEQDASFEFIDMKKLAAILTVFAFVAIQFIDIAVLDSPSFAAPGSIVQIPHDSDDLPIAGGEVQCGCHALHHMALNDSGAAHTLDFHPAVVAPTRSGAAESLSQAPPVPPPLA